MGDSVDRGERSVEIVMLLLAYKALCPSGIILLQGNHEAQSTNDFYGFKNEVWFKLDRGGKGRLWQTFSAVFAKLPFVAVAEDEFMATHVRECLQGSRGRLQAVLDRRHGIGDGLVRSTSLPWMA